jgi:bacillithiol system protein YtxJ
MRAREVEARAQTLRTPDEVDAFLLRHSVCALFKAGSCSITTSALETLARPLEQHPALPVGLIRVVECRAASEHVAELTGVRHASPQILLVRDGRVVHARDNWDISADALRSALEEHFASDDQRAPG